MQPSKSVSRDRVIAPLAMGCTSCACVILSLGQRDHGWDAGRSTVGRKGRGGVAGGGADHCLYVSAHCDHFVDGGHKHRDAEVLERACVAVAALFDPEVLKADLIAESLGPEEVGTAFVE